MLSHFLNLSFLQQILIIYLVLINVLTFFYYGFDKMRSQVVDALRVSEKTLWLLALIGGSVGALAGMRFFRHKTKKTSFQAGLAIILTLQVWIILSLFGYNPLSQY